MRSKKVSSFQFPVSSWFREWKWTVLWGIVILGIAIFLRTYNIFSIPIFADEAIYVRWAQVMRNEPTLRFLPLSDGKQPLFMWSVMGVLQFFQDPLIAARIVSAFSGIASLAGIFLLTHRLFKTKRGALLASLLYAVSPFSVFFDRMALVDSMLTMFGIWALYFGILAAQTLRLDFAMLTGFALGAAWLTKSPAIFFLILLPTTLLVSKWPTLKEKRILHLIKLAFLWGVSWFMALVMYNTLRLGPNFHLIATRNRDYVFTFQEALRHPLDPLQFHIKEIIQWFWGLLPGTVLLVAVFGILLGWKKYRRQLLLLAVWAVLPLLVQAEFAKVFTARYILFTVPPIFILAAAPAALALQRLRARGMWVVAVAVVAPALWIDYLFLAQPEKAPLPRNERAGYLEAWTAGTGIREVAKYMEEEHEKNPGQGIVVGTEGYFGTLPDGLQIYLADLPHVTVIGVGISISEIHSSLLEAKEAGNRAYLVVNTSRLTAKPEDIGLDMISSYGKAEQPDGTRESLLLLEVTEKALEIARLKNAKENTSGD